MEIEIKLLELMAKNKMRHVTDLSRKSNVTEQAINNVIKGRNKGMRLDTIGKLCKALDCEIGELIVIKK